MEDPRPPLSKGLTLREPGHPEPAFQRHAHRQADLCSIVPCNSLKSLLLVLLQLTNVVLVYRTPFVWLVCKRPFHSWVPSSRFVQGWAKDARGSEGLVVLVHSLQPEARPVIPDIPLLLLSMKLFKLLFCARFIYFKLQLMQELLDPYSIMRKHWASLARLAFCGMQLIPL